MKLLIRKFKSLTDKSIEIPATIEGGNGSGKTTILEAMSFCLTGKNLDGKEFEQVYDNRVDLHEAIADVSYFDDYGNEFRRVVSPVFQTSRSGEEKIKTLQNTVCKKNDIACTDFAPEFRDFYTFGTDYFFRQKWDVQRKIFVDVLKSKMPNYDIAGNSLKKKELERAHKEAVVKIDELRNLLKNTVDPEIPEISTDLTSANEEVERVSKSISENSKEIAEVNRRNNEAMAEFWKITREIEQRIHYSENMIFGIDSQISQLSDSVRSMSEREFKPEEEKPLQRLELELHELHMSLQSGVYNFYDTIEDYAAENFLKNPVLVENKRKIEEIQAQMFDIENASGACPLSGEECKTVKLHAEQSFSMSKISEIAKIRQANRSILEREMNAANSEYNSISAKIERINSEIAEISAENLKIKQRNEELKASFVAEKSSRIGKIEAEIKKQEAEKLERLNTVQSLKIKLTGIKEPDPEKLPEALKVPTELIELQKQFQQQRELQVMALGVIKNNARNREKWEAEIKINQSVLFELNDKIVKIKNEISDYFSNLNGVVATQFPGEIEIDVQLLRYVMSRDEYDDDFKITANEKTFPYECNGALQNNLKLQVLAGMQRLIGYTGATVMDNCEANTTQPINTCGLSCLLARATIGQTLNF